MLKFNENYETMAATIKDVAKKQGLG